MTVDLYSDEYYAQKQRARIAKMTPEDFEPWDSAKERYQTEKIEPLLDLYRQSDHSWFKDFNRRRGDGMHSSDLILRIQKLNPHIFVQQQINFPDDWGLYTENLGKIQFITGLHKGWMTEFSYAIVDDRDLPTKEMRGWRTVLVYCLLKGALTWEGVLAEFGDPNDGYNDARWQEATAEFRHGGEQVSGRNIENAME